MRHGLTSEQLCQLRDTRHLGADFALLEGRVLLRLKRHTPEESVLFMLDVTEIVENEWYGSLNDLRQVIP